MFKISFNLHVYAQDEDEFSNEIYDWAEAPKI